MRTVSKVLTVAGVILAAACNDSPVSPSPNQSDANLYPGLERQLTVMSRNMYVGTDLELFLTAITNPDPQDDIPAVVSAYQTLEETDYDLRVVAIAEEIARTRPAVVGLQEICTIDIELANAQDIRMSIHGDFMVDLNEQLALRGLPYVAAARIESWKIAPVAGVQLVGYNVLLVDPARVRVDAAFSRTYEHTVQANTPAARIAYGWTAIEASFAGKSYTFVTTQLQSGPGFAALRAAQVNELLAAMASRPRVVIVGDFADEPGSPMYRRIRDGGFRDVWTDLRTEPGFTGYMLPNLANEGARLTKRVDYVFAKGLNMPETGRVGGDIFLTGADRSDKIAGPEHSIWPSDHAGVVARLRLPFMSIDE